MATGIGFQPIGLLRNNQPTGFPMKNTTERPDENVANIVKLEEINISDWTTPTRQRVSVDKPPPIGSYLQHVILGDIIRIYGADMGLFRPDHVMVVCADASYRKEISIQHGIPLHAVSVLESVSNLTNCHWGCKLMTEEGDKIYMVHAGKPNDKESWVQCDIMGCTMSPDPVLFSACMKETGCRKTRVLLGKDKWSLRTGFTALTRSAKLKEMNNPSLALAKIKDAWVSRPICTSTVIRTWQRYLVSISNDDEAAFKYITKFCPLMSDRAMPTEMMKALRTTGEWCDITIISRLRVARNKRWSGRALLLEALRICE
eukprot:GEMP01057726.1.p1 GENE.GEMP01057726.1~~GEMP01057726.1.p1  ORF type:complete len:338 (+),score=49.95 GEMP01057726.1:69-1016(+)